MSRVIQSGVGGRRGNPPRRINRAGYERPRRLFPWGSPVGLLVKTVALKAAHLENGTDQELIDRVPGWRTLAPHFDTVIPWFPELYREVTGLDKNNDEVWKVVTQRVYMMFRQYDDKRGPRKLGLSREHPCSVDCSAVLREYYARNGDRILEDLLRHREIRP